MGYFRGEPLAYDSRQPTSRSASSFTLERTRASTAYSSRIGSSTVARSDAVAVATPFRSTRSLPLPEHVASVTAISSSTPEDGLESLRQSLGFNLISADCYPLKSTKPLFFFLCDRRPGRVTDAQDAVRRVPSGSPKKNRSSGLVATACVTARGAIRQIRSIRPIRVTKCWGRPDDRSAGETRSSRDGPDPSLGARDDGLRILWTFRFRHAW